MGRAGRRQQRRDARDLQGHLAGGPARHRQPPRGSSGLLPGLVITLLVVAGLVAFAPGASLDPLRRTLGMGPDRINAAPTIPGAEGQFAFSLTQPDGRSPVGWDPCRPIRYEVNPAGAPAGWQQLVSTAVRRTSRATGLVFEHVGTTSDRDFFARRDHLAGDPAPVLVGWGTAEEFEELAGDVAGLGGGIAVQRPGGRRYYATGSVLLDADAFAGLDGGRHDRGVQQAIVDHEFGHLVGLGHVEDPRELMHGEGVAAHRYGPGDLQGLARVGRLPCR